MKSTTDKLRTYEDIEHTLKKSPRQIKVPAHIYQSRILLEFQITYIVSLSSIIFEKVEFKGVF